MDEQGKADIEQMEILREQALYGPQESRDEAQKEYEKFRKKLLNHEQCETPKPHEN
ncbi:MAG TPA: hypothetical protein VNH22_14985 [Blastocatellia bacterium]|jgi:hypothetical protein|nr:hypothetical protein [Blastocatellia bacterium]